MSSLFLSNSGAPSEHLQFRSHSATAAGIIGAPESCGSAPRIIASQLGSITGMVRRAHESGRMATKSL